MEGGGGGGGGKERIGWWIKVYSFLSLIAKDFQPLSSLYFDVVRGGGEINKKKCVEHFRSICKRMMDILV